MNQLRQHADASDKDRKPDGCSSKVHPDGASHAIQLCELIASRRSVAPKRLQPPGPSLDELEALLSVALTAPDHCALKPWRFLLVQDEDREALGDLFAREKLEHDPASCTEEIAKERSRAMNAPTLLAVILKSTPDHPKAPISKQLISLCASVQNLMLAAHAHGYSSMITSGRKINSPLLQTAFCKVSEETLIGFISIGTPSRAPSKREPVELSNHFGIWIPEER